MTSATYQLPLTNGLVSHAWPPVSLFRDADFEAERLELEARIRSGHYIITLITALDALIDDVPESRYRCKVMLNNLIQDLEYIHERYILIKRPK